MIGICALSKKEVELQLSHIYPKFTINYIKETSNGFLRGYKNLNIRKQDGLKKILLSKESEQQFSKYETWFANNFFHPVIKSNKSKFSYDNHLYYFIMSVLWRTLLLQLELDNIKKQPFYKMLLDCEKEWRLFLSDGYIPNKYIHVFMLIIHPDSIITPNLKSSQYYLLRTLDSTIVTNNNGLIYVYAKLPGFVFWAPIISPYSSSANQIDIMGGHFNSRTYPTEPTIFGFLYNRIEEINKLDKNISFKQKTLILETIRKNPDKFFNSQSGKLVLNPYNS